MLKIIAIALTALFLCATPAWAAEPSGAKLFEVQCAGCHVNGGNIVRRGKTLKLKALEKNGYSTVDAIASIITNGKGNMSAYKDRLSETEIQTVAQYVLDRASQNWK
ncbi:c-type cytochrome [Cyanobacteria bacterium FACHB-DQ100]|uniref:c-type cytochrome n=1 Tax=unclassified Leptolyngbya TaxID=2650499 RepID=UPI00168175B2|nr:c-type cytochrome [Leptolyngbya sp. FACHB-17]MBD1824923.1 c-type cytochrome [Cyanobacteria bacterium FACHB-DQ100]MBD2078773.1 c-type cytochrome [Leptolyngbya sp. FACHB-17]